MAATPVNPGITNFQQQTKSSANKPFPPFPQLGLPQTVRDRFPDFGSAWDDYEKQIALWVLAIQNK